MSPQDQKKISSASNHLQILKNKIANESTFAAKLHDNSPQRDGMTSRISGRNHSTNHSPGAYKSKAYDVNDPDFADKKRQVYGQYRPISSKIVTVEPPQYYKSPTKSVTPMTENPNGSIKLVPCPSCGRKFNPSKA
jgi:hypothetical protein